MTHSIILKKIFSVFLILVLCLVVLEAVLRLGGYVFLTLQNFRNQASLSQKNTYKILCLGESMTALGGKNSYPSQLGRVLNQESPRIKFSIINKGVPAIWTHGILLQLEENLSKYKPDIVVIMAGINDNWNMITDKTIYVGKKEFLKSLRVYKLARWLRYSFKKNDADMSVERQYTDFAITRNSKEFDVLKKNEKLLEDAIKATPSNDELYVKLGICYEDQGKYRESEKMLREAIKINPGNLVAYFELGVCLQRQGRYSESEDVFKKAMRYWHAYVQLGASYRIQRKYAEAEKLLHEGIAKFPGIHWLYFELGMCYKWQGEYQKAEEYFEKAIERDKNKENGWAYIELGRCYNNEGRKEAAEKMFEVAISIDKNNQWGYFELDSPDRNIKRIELDSPTMQYNYQRIAEEIINRGIKLVCVQYPLRSVQSIKNILAPYREKIIFVDNEMSFKKAVMREDYGRYFSDRFAGDFGHCTPKGNRLLAESIANAIIDNVLHHYDRQK